MSEITLTGWHVLDEGRAMLRSAVAGVPADGWQRPTPCRSGTSPRSCSTRRWTSGYGGPWWPGRKCPARTRLRPRGSSVPSRWPMPTPPWTRPGRPGRRSTRTPGAQSIVEPLRQYGAYAEALEPSPGADDAAVLLSYLGRRPDWTA